MPFGFVRQSKYDAAVDALDASRSEIRELGEVNYALDRTAAKYKQERDAARLALTAAEHQVADLRPDAEKHRRAVANLRQNRKPEPPIEVRPY